MKNALILFGFALMMAMPTMASESFQYQSANKISASGRVYATIVAPVSAKVSREMTFGMLVKNKTGQVMMDAAGNRVSNGPGLATSKPAVGIVQFNGPRGHLMTVNISDSKILDNENQALEFIPDISAEGKVFALDNKKGEAGLNIGGTLRLNDRNISGGTRHGFYVVQASY